MSESTPFILTYLQTQVRSLVLHLSAKLGGEDALKQVVKQNAPERVSTQLESVLQVRSRCNKCDPGVVGVIQVMY